MIELIIMLGVCLWFVAACIFVYRQLLRWKLRQLPKVRQTCHVLHHTAEIEKEIYGSVVSTSILRHLEEEQSTCDVEREKRIAAQLSTLAARPQPILPDPGSTLHEGICAHKRRRHVPTYTDQRRTVCEECGKVWRNHTHSWVDTATLSSSMHEEICDRCGDVREDYNDRGSQTSIVN